MSAVADHTLTISGPVNIAAVAGLLPQLTADLPHGDVVVDLCKAEHVDSAAVSLLLHLARIVSGRGHQFRLLNVPASLSALINLYGVDSLLLPDVHA